VRGDGRSRRLNILEYSPLFTVLPSFPPESTLARSAKLSPLFEVRMIVADSWATGTSHARAQQDRGGFEIRRTDWSKVKDRIRKYTSFYWEGKTVYVENIPVQCRSKPAILRLLRDLLHDVLNPGASQSIVEYIQFLPHRDDRPDTPEPFKCKGFAFVTLSSSTGVDSLLERWPWESSKVEVGKTHKAASESGFRALSKRKWEKLKEEYLLYQQQLLADAASHTALPRPRRAMVEDTRETIEKIQSPGLPPSIAQTTYPLNCLIFVKNIQPDTNKTTLRNLFSSVFENPEGQIDYVDYTKGLDICYLRLSTSESARGLVNQFAETQILQSDGLDAIGTKGVKSNAISMELVQGRREELYWEKVPLKIRQQAIAKANAVAPKDREDGADSCSMGGLNEDRRKQKRRKHN